MRDYYSQNRETISKYNKQYSLDNSDSIKEWQKSYSCEYRKNNRVKYNEYHLSYRNRCEQNRLAHILRSRLGSALRGRVKQGSAVRDVGVSMETLLCYLNLGCLDRYGTPYTGFEHLYDVDHIVPLSKFDLSKPEQVKQACLWSNLQVLTKSHNRSKSNRC